MSAYTSGNKAPTLMAQMPNRVGNKATHVASHDKGVTAVTRPQGGLSQPSGAQGAPSFAKATSNTAAGATAGRKQKVMVSQPECYDKTPRNDAYMGKSTKNYLG
jgi:hypothetical protein